MFILVGSEIYKRNISSVEYTLFHFSPTLPLKGTSSSSCPLNKKYIFEILDNSCVYSVKHCKALK